MDRVRSHRRWKAARCSRRRCGKQSCVSRVEMQRFARPGSLGGCGEHWAALSKAAERGRGLADIGCSLVRSWHPEMLAWPICLQVLALRASSRKRAAWVDASNAIGRPAVLTAQALEGFVHASDVNQISCFEASIQSMLSRWYHVKLSHLFLVRTSRCVAVAFEFTTCRLGPVYSKRLARKGPKRRCSMWAAK